MTDAPTVPRVLVFDYHPDAAEATAFHLAHAGFPALACDDSAVALAKAPAYRPDVAVVPLDSAFLVARLRQWADACRRPLVVIGTTGEAGPAARRRASSAGFDLLATGGADASELVGLVDELWREWAAASRRSGRR